MPFLRNSIIFLVLFTGLSGFSQSVYKTPSGKKYHRATCRMVKNVSREISIEEAGEEGLEPRLICKPDVINSSAAGTISKANGTARKTVQCRGFIKAGTRCRHWTRIANGYCFQHQPKK